MVRVSIREKIEQLIPQKSFSAFFAIFSGIMLTLVVLFWQESPYVIFSISTPYTYALYFLQSAAVVGIIWGIRSLKNFDPFGNKQISLFINKKPERVGKFKLRGPYKFTRHPLYFFMLILIWTHPIITLDRLLFISLWTIWIWIGTILEEKDLVVHFGDHYREYQRNVPMLIPYTFFKNGV